MNTKLVKKILNSFAARAGLTSYNRGLLYAMQHTRWIMNMKKIRTRPLVFTPPVVVSEKDVVLCERLIIAYYKAKAETIEDFDEEGGLWDSIHSSFYNKLIYSLAKRNANTLAHDLSTMFMQDFLVGISSGSLVRQARTRLGSRIWCMKCIDDIVSLAEYLGVVRTECPEQGVLGYALIDGLDPLVRRIEETLGLSIGFPQIGAAYGIMADSSLITMESSEHLYAALRLNKCIALYGSKTEPSIVEIGAGFGGTAHWLLKLRGTNQNYTIIDLPLSNVIQGYFLTKVFGVDKVDLFGERTDLINNKTINILPNSCIKYDQKFDIMFNENSLPEIPEKSALAYIEWAGRNIQEIFFSYNQEAYSPVAGTPQILVPKLINEMNSFQLKSRNQSWIRRGYVEEVYIKKHNS